MKTFLLTVLFICATKGYPAKDEIIHHYIVRMESDLSAMHVEVKFGNIDFFHLYAGSNEAPVYLKNMILKKNGKTTYHTTNNHEIELKRNAAGATLYYSIDLKEDSNTNWRNPLQRVDNDIIFSPEYWLWRPYDFEDWEHIEIEFDFPAGINYSVPWIPVAKNTYRVNAAPYNWSSCAAFGSFHSDTVAIKDSKLSIAFLGNYITTEQELSHWIKNAAASISQVYGAFPVKNTQIVLVPIGDRKEPVPFGMVVRGGGISVIFYIDPSEPIEKFIADWTATHELGHTLLPFVNRDQAWLSEGLATYYQYILMGRDGRLTQQEAWQRIYNGFQKGIRDSRGKTLMETSANMRQERAFKNVYWSGAAMLFKTDVLLREKSNGQFSLDKALKAIHDKKLWGKGAWRAEDLFRELDAYCASDIFMKMYNLHVNDAEFPVDDDFWRELGIFNQDGIITLTDQGPLVSIREQIIPPQSIN